MRERWIDSPAADAEAERLAEARDGYGPAEADHGSLDGPGGPGDPDPDEEYAGEGDAGRGAVQTTGEHLTAAPASQAPQLWTVTLTYPIGRRKLWHHAYAVLAASEAEAITRAVAYAQPAAGVVYTTEAEADPDGVVSQGSHTSWRPAAR